MSERTFDDRMARPDNWHMPAAYWFWHQLPTPDEIRRQVGEMKDAGILSFQVQARMAYPIEGYLDDDYLAACRIAVGEAARLGMMVGVYDDYNWQTGHAGGRAVAGHDHLRERQLFWATGEVRDGVAKLEISDIHSSTESLGAPGMAWHYDGGVAEWTQWEVPFAFARLDGGVLDVTRDARVAHADKDGARVAVAVPGVVDGTVVTAFIGARSTTSRLVNFLDEEAAARFVEAGYEPFHRELGEYFGSTITYFFFDQPHTNFYRWRERHGNLHSPIPYHSDLPELIRQRWPESYGEVLLALLDGEGALDRSRRADFYDFFSKRAMKTFLGALHEWTAEKGVALSGHEVLAHVGQWDLSGAFGEWDLRINFGLDYFGVDSYRDLTGVDAQDSVPQLSAKFGDSVARSNGRSGTIVEQYFAKSHTGSGVYAGHWGLTLEELRAQAFRHHLFGMRQFLFHGFYQTDGFDDDPTMFSNPRFDFPPGHNFEPWFRQYHAGFAIESGRLSEFLDNTTPTCDVAVLYPLRTVWAEGQNGDHAREGGAWYERLARAAYGYHLIDEKDLLAAEARDGRVWFGDRGYASVILPGVTTLASAETIAALGRLADADVTVIATGAVPTAYQSGEQTAVEDWARLARRGSVRVLETVPQADRLREVLGEPGTHGVQFEVESAASVWTWSGRTGSQWRAVAFNDGAASATVGVLMPAGPVSRLDVATGASTAQSGSSEFAIVLEPQEIALFSTGSSNSDTPRESDTTLRRLTRPREFGDTWTLAIDADQHAYAGSEREISTGRGWEGQGLADFSGTATYRTHLEIDRPRAARITLPDISGSATILVNGRVVGARGWTPYRFDAAADDWRIGDNIVEIVVASTAANRYYAGTGMREGPEPAGLLATPVIQFETRGQEDA